MVITVSVGLLAMAALILAIIAPGFGGYFDFRNLSAAEQNLRKIIEAEDECYQRTGAYFPLESDAKNASVKRILGQSYTSSRDDQYTVGVSGLAFTAEAKVRIKGRDNYLGYVRTAPGEHRGIVGKIGACDPSGISAGSRNLVNVLGPCRPGSWANMGVVSGTMRRLAIETLPSGADISINGKREGKSGPFRGTISDRYGYFFASDLPESPITVVVSKDGFSPVTFTLDWSTSTYRAAVVLRKN